MLRDRLVDQVVWKGVVWTFRWVEQQKDGLSLLVLFWGNTSVLVPVFLSRVRSSERAYSSSQKYEHIQKTQKARNSLCSGLESVPFGQ